ncbi:MAG: hypothetical protein CBB72_012040 [Muricauda sp. TMED12]|nr:MAG: hypothetical protein CBB72_012040 [Muricauda sp. TMED12]
MENKLSNALLEEGFHLQEYTNLFDEDGIKRFQNYWHNLPEDSYIKGDFKYRQRRYSKFNYNPKSKKLKFLSSSYFQEEEHNNIYGGKDRVFFPLETNLIKDPFLQTFLELDFAFFLDQGLLNERVYEVGVHQMRTISNSSAEGIVTPEGMHKDGHFAFAVHFINRNNILGGTTNLYDNNKSKINSMVLKSFGETLFIEDDKLFHEVTPIRSVDSEQVGYRDVLIIEFY